MGYYVDYEGSISYPRADEQRLAEALWALNHRHELKNGGRHPKQGDPYEDNWFSWLPSRWHENEPSVREVLELLGFEVDEKFPDGDLVSYAVSYSNKIGDEDKFIATLAENGAAVVLYCRGEVGDGWRGRTYNNELVTANEYRPCDEAEYRCVGQESYRAWKT